MTLTPACCKAVRERLARYPWRKEARDFFDQHGETLADLATDQLQAFANAARRGKRDDAYAVLIRNAPLRTWVSERHKTTTMLIEVAQRMHAAAEAFRKLGWWALRVLGRVLGAVL